MRAFALVVVLGVAAGCAGRIDVAAEDRFDITATTSATSLPPIAVESLPSTTTTTIQSGTTDPESTLAESTVPQSTVPSDPAVAALLLVDGDLDAWEIGPPNSVGPQSYRATTCDAVDVLRRIDETPKRVTTGRSGGATFNNFLFEMSSENAAALAVDAARSAASSCDSFEDQTGTSTVRSFPVPPVVGWDAAAVVFGGSTPAATIGYWQSSSTLVKLRVFGDRAEERFTELATVLSAKLTAVMTGAPFDPDAVESGEGGPWQAHELAPLVLDGADIGAAWERYNVEVLGSGPLAWVPGGCDIVEPFRPVGLVADFEIPDHDGIFVQGLFRSTPEQAQTWVDVHRRLGETCTETDTGQRVSPLAVPPAGEIGADDIVAIRYVASDFSYYYDGLWISVRFDDLYVDLLWSAAIEGGSPNEMPTVDEMLRLAANIGQR